MRPRWEQAIEVPLRGGTMGGDGIFRNAAAATTRLRVEVVDSNLGTWGVVLHALELLGGGLAVGLVVGEQIAAHHLFARL